MEILQNGFTLALCEGAFPLSTDSVALSGFVKLPKNAKVLDLCAGCGTLGVLLCAKDAGCCVTGIEIDPNAHEAALANARDNQIQHRLQSICADVETVDIPTGSFHVCVSNPPYFTGGPASKLHPTARMEASLSLETVFRQAAKGLQYGGDFCLVHKPERLAEICALGSKYQLEPKRLLLLRHRADGPVSLVLVQCRKGGKPGLIWEEESLHHPDGSPTHYYKTLYHLQEV